MSLLNNQSFIDANKATIQALNLDGEVYTQNARLYFPINGVYTETNAFTFYQNNTYNNSKKQFEELQAWPRLMPNGEIAWALQKIDLIPETPAYRFSFPGPPVRAKQTYKVQFNSPVLIDSAITQVDPSGGTPITCSTAVSDTAKIYELSDHVTGQSIYSETTFVIVPNKRRHYNNYLQLFVDPSGFFNPVLYVYIDSQGGVAPQVISDAMNAYRNGTIQMRDDPANPGQLVPLYVPSLDGGNSLASIPTITEPEHPSSFNKNFKGHCIGKNGEVCIPE